MRNRNCILKSSLNIKPEIDGGLIKKGYFKEKKEGKSLVSVITVSYNAEAHIEKTIQSVLNQTYNNIEYIIIDGRSGDQTVEIIKRYDNVIDYWISEPDNVLRAMGYEKAWLFQELRSVKISLWNLGDDFYSICKTLWKTISR